MAQNYGAAQPIADWVNNYVASPVQRVLGAIDKLPVPLPQKKVDTSWHDDMVRKANQSFQQKPENAKPKTPPKYHQGTDYVPKTGPAILKKGEAVLNEKDADNYRATKGKDMAKDSKSSRAHSVLGGSHKSKSKKKGGHPHRIEIRHGKSGGHVVTHHFAPDEDGMTPDSEEHVIPDKASLMDHLDQNIPDQAAPQVQPPDMSSQTPPAPAGGPPAAGPAPVAGM